MNQHPGPLTGIAEYDSTDRATDIDLSKGVAGASGRYPRFFRVVGGDIALELAAGGNITIPAALLAGDLPFCGAKKILASGSTFASCLVGW